MALARGRHAAKRERDGEDVRRFRDSGTLPSLPSRLPCPSEPLRETAILFPLWLLKMLLLMVIILQGGAGNLSDSRLAFGKTLPVNLDATFLFSRWDFSLLPASIAPHAGLNFPGQDRGPTARMCSAVLDREAAPAQPACGMGAGLLGLRGSPGSQRAHPCAFFSPGEKGMGWACRRAPGMWSSPFPLPGAFGNSTSGVNSVFLARAFRGLLSLAAWRSNPTRKGAGV